jgi:hypothetical protein
MSENILDAVAIKKYVLGDEGDDLRVMSFIKKLEVDQIIYSIGLTSHKRIAEVFGIKHSEVGFAGRIQGRTNKEARMSRGGGSLSADYNKNNLLEQNCAFELVSAMLVQCGGELSWDNSI